ncbi:unnamed protein product [Linum trigynum]|uniref:Uncharacterized protein n=1 Tax=Linum trigynum TaxID=586398 RepID=A0AAV2GHZ5_9ROSI
MRQFHQQYEEWVDLLVDQAPMVSCPVVQPGSQVGDPRLVCMWDGATRRGVTLGWWNGSFRSGVDTPFGQRGADSSSG